MAINVVCGQCNQRLRFADEQAGKKVRCQGCGQPVWVPTLEPLEELPDAPTPKPPPLSGPPPLPAPRRTAPVTPPPLRSTSTTPWQPWLDKGMVLLRDRRVQIGLGCGVAFLFLLLLLGLFSLSGGKKDTATGGGSGSDSTSAQKDMPIGRGGGEDPQPPAVPVTNAAAGVLPPRPAAVQACGLGPASCLGKQRAA